MLRSFWDKLVSGYVFIKFSDTSDENYTDYITYFINRRFHKVIGVFVDFLIATIIWDSFRKIGIH